MTNGEPVLFGAVELASGTSYGFTCLACGRHQADQPDTLCPDCQKPTKTRRSTRPRGGGRS